jgi:hypothetical protein
MFLALFLWSFASAPIKDATHDTQCLVQSQMSHMDTVHDIKFDNTLTEQGNRLNGLLEGGNKI